MLPGDLTALLSDAGRPVVLEITEHATDDYTALRAALAQIHLPVRVGVDDAGSSYASLRHILALRPANVLRALAHGASCCLERVGRGQSAVTNTTSECCGVLC